jgi:ArsR family transcriptional regulator
MKVSSPHSLVRSAKLFKALSDPVRLRLLNLLDQNREVCVCHLHLALDLPQPTVSRHLSYLRKTALVATRKQGLWVYYRLAKPSGRLHRALIRSMALLDDERLAHDRDRLGRLTSECESP